MEQICWRPSPFGSPFIATVQNKFFPQAKGKNVVLRSSSEAKTLTYEERGAAAWRARAGNRALFGHLAIILLGRGSVAPAVRSGCGSCAPCARRCLRRCRSVACWPAPCRRLVARGRRESRARPRLIDRTGRVAGSEGTRAAVHAATVCARLDGDQQGCVWALSAPNARMQRCVRALSACVSCGRRHLA